MPRPGYRARLEGGLKLDLNRLARQGLIRRGAYTRGSISWTNNYTGEEIASGTITADMTRPGIDGSRGWIRIQIGQLDQRIHLVARPRHFGGRQWFFICPYLDQRCTVLWMPPGARDFACRQKWGRRVAYNSQFLDRNNQAHRGKERIKSRLCRIGGFDPEQWEFPPKPKWMRWSTYKRAKAKFDRYESILDQGALAAVIRLLGRG